MRRHDLRARSVFHHQQDAIEAHLTVVKAGLAIGRIVEHKTGTSIKWFAKTLQPIHSGTITLNGQEYPVYQVYCLCNTFYIGVTMKV